MMEAIKAVIVRLHAKRKTVAACDQTVATQQLLWRKDSQAALLEEHVNEYRAELEREAVEEARTEAEELREEQIQAALRKEQTQGAPLEQHEVAEMDGLLVRGDAAEMREWFRKQKRQHKAASKGGGLGLFIEKPRRNNE